MRWPWSKHHEPEPVISDDDTAELEQAQQRVERQHQDLTSRIPEIDRVTRSILEARDRNHLAEKFRIAFGGGPHGHGG